jgi:dephospho-CoA kinase
MVPGVPGRGLRIVLVAGMPGSGKSLVSSAARALGIPVVTMGDVVREEARRRGVEPSPEALNRIAAELRRRYGAAVVAERVARRLPREGVVVVDGVRSLAEVEVFKRRGEVFVVAVHASPRTRFERILRRRRPGDASTWEEFVERDMVELGFGLGDVIALADYMIVNEAWRRPEEVVEEARGVLERLLGSGPLGSRGGQGQPGAEGPGHP